jgi:prepilin-type N-terminal cleavage/methylation domain-containing protein
MRRQSLGGGQGGFSLIELMVAMGVTLIVMTMASKTLMQCFNVRSRQDTRAATLADVQRALNIVSREVASAGYGLTTNGVVGCAPGGSCDSNFESIRIRANLNRLDSTPPDADTNDDNEDVKYFLNDSARTRYLVRYNANSTGIKATVLANRIDALQFHYFDRRVTYSTLTYDPDDEDASLITGVRNSAGAAQAEVSPTLAKYVVVVVAVHLPAVGTPGSEGYQPETQEMLASDISLRNNDLANY